MIERPAYVAPTLVEVGTLEELTMTVLQKVGTQSDALTNLPPPLGGLTGHISLLPN
ncbi:MAG: hypothetical protein QOJ58_5423 [Alphaproteobacteria bacterium]|jgi:hypothetical protein|nr:hypothetical protein [Alphaproteobacteria bacterium]